MVRTIALTGATGFIGGAVAARLLGAGYRVRALVRPGSVHKCSQLPAKIEWVKGDCAEKAALGELLAGADSLIHCAGAVRGASAPAFSGANEDGVASLAQAAQAQKSPPRFLLISSLAAREPQLSLYAASKRAGEEALRRLGENLFWTVFRPAAVYGPGDRELLPLFQTMFRGIAPVLGSPASRVSMLYVGDLAAAILTWLERPGLNHAVKHAVYEVGDGRPQGYTWQEIIDIAAQCRGKGIVRIMVPDWLAKTLAQCNLAAAGLSGHAPMLTPWKVRELLHPNWVADSGPLTAATGWQPEMALAEGICRTMGLDMHKGMA
ncbi:MAG: NAD-dependent epimerase/dehydratase family protein [bacterium]|nr:NAD-dependent epimerase/dehydratase family protein [bacterium]